MVNVPMTNPVMMEAPIAVSQLMPCVMLSWVTLPHSERRILELSVMSVASVRIARGLMASIIPMATRMDQLAKMCPNPPSDAGPMSSRIAPTSSSLPTILDPGCAMVPAAFARPTTVIALTRA